MSTPPQKVLIVGAGLGGLCLAQSLRKAGIHFEVFERDHDDHSRKQGYAINLSEGIKPMHELFPTDMPDMEASISVLHPLGQVSTQMRIFNAASGDILTDIPHTGKGEKNEIIRVNRSHMRSWLSSNIDVKWNKKFVKYEEHADGVTVHFSDGTSSTGDVLIGADGANSHVRQQMLGDKVTPNLRVPVGCITGVVELDQAAMNRSLQLCRGPCIAVSKSVTFFQSPRRIANDLKSGDWYWTLSFDDPAAEKDGDSYWVEHASQEKLHAYAIDLLKNVNPKFKEGFDATKTSDIGHLKVTEWIPPETLPQAKVTLLGDAAHTTTPFRGAGANCAFLDAFDLARAFISANTSNTPFASLFKPYEEVMIPRGQTVVRVSHETAFSGDRMAYSKKVQEKLDEGEGWGFENKRLDITNPAGK